MSFLCGCARRKRKKNGPAKVKTDRKQDKKQAASSPEAVDNADTNLDSCAKSLASVREVHVDIDVPQKGIRDCDDGNVGAPQYATGRPTMQCEPEAAPGKPELDPSAEEQLLLPSCHAGESLNFVDDHFDRRQPCGEEVGTLQQQQDSQNEDGPPPPELLRLPESLLRSVHHTTSPVEIKRLEKEFWEKMIQELKENMGKYNEEQQKLVREEAADLRGGQRRLQLGLEALEEMLRVGQQPPSTPSTPQVHRLPPHIVGIALKVEDKFYTVPIVKDFFRQLGMNPAEIEWAAKAQDCSSGPRDLFWSLLVSHDLSLSLVGKTINMADFLDACEASHIQTRQCSVMPKAHRQLLENCLLDLVATLNVDLLKPFLTSSGILTSPSVKHYVMECTRTEQVLRLLDVLPMLGEDALCRLIEALLQTQQPHVAKIIADELEKSGSRTAQRAGLEERPEEGAEPELLGSAHFRTGSLEHRRRHRERRKRRTRSLSGRLTSVQEEVHIHYDHKGQTVTMATRRE